MSRWVQDGGRILPASLFEPWPGAPPTKGECPQCGGLGELTETIDAERFDVVVVCFRCRVFCKACRKYVRKPEFGGHECAEAKP